MTKKAELSNPVFIVQVCVCICVRHCHSINTSIILVVYYTKSNTMDRRVLFYFSSKNGGGVYILAMIKLSVIRQVALRMKSSLTY